MATTKVKVGPKGQIIIPKPLRDRLGIRAGDEMVYTFHDGHLHLERAPADDWALHWHDAPTLPTRPGLDLDALIEEGMAEELGRPA
ncbi:MAG: AbrB/MazE/SpoVT family DNA-binding domain-containing protein [Thermoplasmatota archaeon]